MGQKRKKQAKPLQDKASTDKGNCEKEVADREKYREKGAESGNTTSVVGEREYFYVCACYAKTA